MVDIGAARQYYDERETQRRTQREAERQQWLQCVREAILQLAQCYPGVRRVYLFGSLVQPGRFRPDSDMEAIATIYDELERHPLQADTGGDTLIVIGYHLHNLYNAFENIFQNVAVVFENSTDDVAQWHTQLVMGKALALKSIYVHQLFQLMSFLQNLAKPT